MSEHSILSRILCRFGAHVWGEPYNPRLTKIFRDEGDAVPSRIFEFRTARCKLCGQVRVFRSKR